MNSVNGMQEWDSDAENTEVELCDDNSLSNRDDLDLFYDQADLEKIHKRLMEISSSRPLAQYVEGLIVLPKKGKNLQDITKLTSFLDATQSTDTKNWYINDTINGILIYFKKPQDYKTTEMIFLKVWGVDQVCKLKVMDEIYKQSLPKGSLRIIKTRQSSR